MNESSIDCRIMTGPERLDVFALMHAFRTDDKRLGDALTLFAEREDYGIVWLAYRDDELVGCCTVGFAIDTRAGGIVVDVRDLYVVPHARRGGVASRLLQTLVERVTLRDAVQLRVAAESDDVAQFLAARGFAAAADRTFTQDR